MLYDETPVGLAACTEKSVLDESPVVQRWRENTDVDQRLGSASRFHDIVAEALAPSDGMAWCATMTQHATQSAN